MVRLVLEDVLGRTDMDSEACYDCMILVWSDKAFVGFTQRRLCHCLTGLIVDDNPLVGK